MYPAAPTQPQFYTPPPPTSVRPNPMLEALMAQVFQQKMKGVNPAESMLAQLGQGGGGGQGMANGLNAMGQMARLRSSGVDDWARQLSAMMGAQVDQARIGTENQQGRLYGAQADTEQALRDYEGEKLAAEIGATDELARERGTSANYNVGRLNRLEALTPAEFERIMASAFQANMGGIENEAQAENAQQRTLTEQERTRLTESNANVAQGSEADRMQSPALKNKGQELLNRSRELGNVSATERAKNAPQREKRIAEGPQRSTAQADTTKLEIDQVDKEIDLLKDQHKNFKLAPRPEGNLPGWVDTDEERDAAWVKANDEAYLTQLSELMAQRRELATRKPTATAPAAPPPPGGEGDESEEAIQFLMNELNVTREDAKRRLGL